MNDEERLMAKRDLALSLNRVKCDITLSNKRRFVIEEFVASTLQSKILAFLLYRVGLNLG